MDSVIYHLLTPLTLIGLCIFLPRQMWILQKIRRHTMTVLAEVLAGRLPESFKRLLVRSVAFRALLVNEEYLRRLADMSQTYTSGSEDHEIILARVLEPGMIPLPDQCSSLLHNEDFQNLLKHPDYPELMLGKNNSRLVAAVKYLF